MVDGAVDLDEVRGPEVEPQVEVVEAVVQVDRARRSAARRYRSPPGCSRMRRPWARSNSRSAARSGSRQRIEHAQHQHAFAVRQRHLDLRNALAPLHAGEQLAERRRPARPRARPALRSARRRRRTCPASRGSPPGCAPSWPRSAMTAARAGDSPTPVLTRAAATRPASTLPMRVEIRRPVPSAWPASCARRIEVLQRAAAADAEVRAARRHALRAKARAPRPAAPRRDCGGSSRGGS